AGLLTAAGGYVVGSLRARRGGATFSVAPLAPAEGGAHG
ncbi:glycosyltransferase family 2 protein, partial [Streptomyces sp. SID5789]|nr:glycosyltransferase family 2 protein [Streptomyces sp. SID5789]